ncbi:universal stress protein [Pontibacter sp. Tf4]|uniref:universal stress protein n=1 Tax=Pontibacter sp. Tf4 TaxID=2761620 RepID=UPI00162A5FF3|nr:universal stress protein [Pontibacter sp. Tf4]MBB6610984.1 universal stress protein [Pontibacter sp. Tf4]
MEPPFFAAFVTWFEPNYNGVPLRILYPNLTALLMFRILVPVDLTENATKVCDFALAFSRHASHTQMVLLHCYQDYLDESTTGNAFSDPASASELVTDRVLLRNQQEAEEKLDKLYLAIRKTHRHLQLERVLMYGLPEECIKEEVQRFKPDLLVMATKGESNIARTFFGTVSTNIIKEVTVPVLTVPATYDNTTIKRVLYATDFDKSDTAALNTLQQLVQPFGAVIECVHVADEPNSSEQAELEALRQKLQQTATSNLNYTLLDGADVADALQRFVTEQAIDMLALTTRSRTLLGSLLNPSLAKRMVLESQVPLLILHAAE